MSNKKRCFGMNNCNGSTNEKLIISATNYARSVIGIDESLWVFINDGKIFKSINHSGMYDKEHFVIRYNRDWLKTAEFERIIKCAFHEVFHVVQHAELIVRKHGIKSKVFSDAELDQLEFEFMDENYSDSHHAWGSHLAEQQADSFADELYGKFIKNYQNTDDFIAKYYEMYPNKE